MTHAEIMTRLKAIEPEIRARGVSALYIYGSYARNDARPDSDLDILVDFEPGKGRGIVAYMAPYDILEDRFPGIEIGYSSRDALAPAYRPSIEESAIRVF
jgi:uncharacterized protein